MFNSLKFKVIVSSKGNKSVKNLGRTSINNIKRTINKNFHKLTKIVSKIKLAIKINNLNNHNKHKLCLWSSRKEKVKRNINKIKHKRLK